MFGREKKPEGDWIAYVVYDSKSGHYDVPVFQKNDEVIKRDILNMFRNPANRDSKLLVNAEDYSIFRCGSFDMSTGTFIPTQLIHVVNVHDLRSLVGQDVGEARPQPVLSIGPN